MKDVVVFGEPGTKFYIILKGVMQVEIPNTQIEDRYAKWLEYQILKEWKKKTFDVKVEQAK